MDAGRLTRRESDVLDGLLLGRTYSDVALIYGLSVYTVKWHVKNILEKLHADSSRDFFRVIAQQLDD